MFVWSFRRLLWLALFLVAVPLPGLANASPSASAASRQPVRAAFEVLAVDVTQRSLLVKRDGGSAMRVFVDRALAGLDELAVGDLVIAEYRLARAMTVKNLFAAAPPASSVALPPAKAAGLPPRRLIVADIIAIDDRSGQMTLKSDDGEIVELAFQRRRLLKHFQIGGRVRATYADPVVFSLKPAGRAIPLKRADRP